MQLRSFTLNVAILDIEEDTNRFYADPDAANDQSLFNDNITQTVFSDQLPKSSESDKIHSEHGTIFYEHTQRSLD